MIIHLKRKNYSDIKFYSPVIKFRNEKKPIVEEAVISEKDIETIPEEEVRYIDSEDCSIVEN